MDKFQDALDGKTTTEGWTAEELVDYHKFVSDKVKEEEKSVAGLREAKRAETDRITNLKSEAERIAKEIEAKKNAPPEANPPNPEMTQFRKEQVEKAKNRLFSEKQFTEEERTAILEKFARLDSGKLDADFIYQDLLSSVAAANPSKFLELTKKAEYEERMAKEEEARQAAGESAPPTGEEKKVYSDEAQALAKKAGITPAEAERQVKQGMSRIIE